jgi:hypothetical protein
MALQQHQSAGNTSIKKEKNIHINGSNDFPYNNATIPYVLMKFNIKNMFLKNLKDYNDKPNLAEILHKSSQDCLNIKSKSIPPGHNYNMSVDVLLTEIICEELFNEFGNEYDDIFEINKL